jgi:pimeloyl-ACP methyl ester carboxylesterase
MSRSPMPSVPIAVLLLTLAWPVGAAVPCESLAGKQYYNVTVTSAEAVPASKDVPAFCRVRGHEPGTDHDLEVRLPEVWRGRYVQRGGGGFDGGIPPLAVSAAALRLGAVQGTNNGGHRDPTGAALRGDARATERYAHGAILIATRFGKAVTQAYYGKAPAHSYYEGCSNGGRGALNAAAKYGTEFEGVIAVAPTLNTAGQIAAWTRAAALEMPTAAQFASVHAAAAARCDALDGLKDGIIGNWQRCDFEPGRDLPAGLGLSAGQQAAVRTLTNDLKAADGRVLYSGFGLGDLAPGAPAWAQYGTGQMRYIVKGDAAWSPQGFDVDRELPAIQRVIDDRYQFSASVPGLVQFLEGGGKLMVWHGSDDAFLSHKDTIRSWEQLAAASRTLLEDQARLYIAPGVGHCAGGPGADDIDSLSAMIDWVEHRKAPGTLTARKRDRQTGAVQFSRPLCRHPAWPRYGGKGDPDSATSFRCVAE